MILRPVVWRTFLAIAVLLGAGGAANAQTDTAAASAGEVTIALDTAEVGNGPWAVMRMLYERTFLAVDVLRLTVELGPEDAERIGMIAAGRKYSDELADSIAQIAIHSRNAFVRSRFQRDVSQEQYFDGVEDNMEKALEAGIIERSTYDMIMEGLPVWYAFLEDRGIKDGEQLLYRIKGDTLRSLFVAADGEILRDQTDVGPERRLSVLGSYFAEDSNFREKLIKSLFGKRN